MITVSQLFESALCLSPESRVALAEQLIGSIEPDHDLFQAQVAEAERRAEEMNAGRVKGIPGEEALRRVRESILRKSEA
ncbi:MAG TPA: addiction module protein [Prosthecobacter sp.]